MNYLNAIFWDYPEFTHEETLRAFLKRNHNSKLYSWMMTRFLEYGRVVDSLHYFTIDEIAKYLPKLKIASYTLKKWKRLIEVYGKH